MSPAKRTSPAVKPAPEKKKQAPEAVKPKVAAKPVKIKVTAENKASAPLKKAHAALGSMSVKSKPPSKRMHPEAIKRRDARLKAKAPKPKPSPPSTNQIDVPLVAREIPKDTYTVVYAGSVMWLDSKKARHKLQRGETLDLTLPGYEICSNVLKRALVKGNLTMDQVHKLLADSKGQVPGAVAFGKAPLEAIDFASALPVKDQESQATSVSLSLPNFVPMATDDIKAWAGQPAIRAWLSDLPDGKKHELVTAIKARAAEVEADAEGQSSVKPTAPEGAFEDL